MERNAAFDRCIDFLVRMMEKYSNEVVFPEEIPEIHQINANETGRKESRGEEDAPAPIHNKKAKYAEILFFRISLYKF